MGMNIDNAMDTLRETYEFLALREDDAQRAVLLALADEHVEILRQCSELEQRCDELERRVARRLAHDPRV